MGGGRGDDEKREQNFGWKDRREETIRKDINMDGSTLKCKLGRYSWRVCVDLAGSRLL
jgi:hypothetical protein